MSLLKQAPGGPELGFPSLERAEMLEMKTYENVTGVGDGSNDSSSDHQLFPGLGDVDDVNSFIVAFVHVWVHQA